MLEWQLIETAPRDGTWIMSWWRTMSIKDYPCVVYYEEGCYGNPAAWSTVVTDSYGCDEVYPTHWLALPDPPTLDEEE